MTPNPWTCTTCAAPIDRGEHYWIRMESGEGESHCARCAGARRDREADPLTSILERWARLGKDERRVLEYISERLEMGQAGYGKLNIATDPRNWEQEAREEAADLAIYRAIAGVKGGER